MADRRAWRDTLRSPWFWRACAEMMFMGGTLAVLGGVLGAIIMWKIDHGR